MSEDIPDETWAAWARMLSTGAKYKLAATRAMRAAAAKHEYGSKSAQILAEAEQAEALHDLAVELRDRLRYSHNRCTALKTELLLSQQRSAAELAGLQQATSAQLASMQQQLNQLVQQADSERARERLASNAQIADFQDELARLNQGVAGQAAAIDSQQQLVVSLQQQLLAAHQELRTAEAQRSAADIRAGVAEQRLAEVSQEVVVLQQEVSAAGVAADAARSCQAAAEHKQLELANELIRAKVDHTSINQVEAMYTTARDELARLATENEELRDLVVLQAGSHTPVSLGSTNRMLPRSCSPGRSKAAPLHMKPEMQGKKRSAVTGHKLTSKTSQNLSRRLERAAVARDVLFEYDHGLRVRDTPVVLPKSPARNRPGSAGSVPTIPVEELQDLAWVGLPTSAYPPDPENFEFVRVAGGYSPRYVGTCEQPKPSGWVPKDLIRIIQAFRQSYDIDEPGWEAWEPLMLLIDDVYRACGKRVSSKTKGARAAKATKPQSAAQAAGGAHAKAPYASVLQAARIAYLKKQLGQQQQHTPERGRPRTAGAVRRDDVVRHLARKDYHLFNQLDEALDLNVQLKRAQQELDRIAVAADGF